MALPLLVILILAGCIKTGESYGADVSQSKQVTVKDLYSGTISPSEIVMIEGKITTECPAGCWFYLKDSTGSVYVQLPDFIIPQKTGARVRVYGTFASSGQPPRINPVTGQVLETQENVLSGIRVEIV
jgi:hypothetical protein